MRGAARQLPAALLLLTCLTIVAFSSSGHAKTASEGASGYDAGTVEATGSPEELADSEERFLLPLLCNGPNNQLANLRESMGMAWALNRTLILTGIFEHYRELDRLWRLHPFKGQRSEDITFLIDTLFDRKAMRETLPTVNVNEFKSRGWTGTVDAVLESRDNSVSNEREEADMIRMEAMFHIHTRAECAPRVQFGPEVCTEKGMAKLRSKLEKYRVVMQVPSATYAHSHILHDQGLCKEGMDRAAAAVQWSSAVSKMAKQYVAEHMAGEPFVAAHVRPYPDTCMDLWIAPGSLPIHQLVKQCQNGALFQDLSSSILTAMKKAKTKHVFIISHPAIRWRINQELAKVKVTPHYLDNDSPAFASYVSTLLPGIPLLRTYNSSTLVLWGEQAIAEQAAEFIGTACSSSTWSIIMDRLGRRYRAKAAGPKAKSKGRLLSTRRVAVHTQGPGTGLPAVLEVATFFRDAVKNGMFANKPACHLTAR